MRDFNPHDFAKSWVGAWNRRDIKEVLSHYSPQVVLFSPIAAQVIGNGVIRGKPDLRAYWEKALAQRASFEFVLQDVAWDESSRILSIFYLSTSEGGRRMVCECEWFDVDGLITRSAAYYGPEVAADEG